MYKIMSRLESSFPMIVLVIPQGRRSRKYVNSSVTTQWMHKARLGSLGKDRVKLHNQAKV